MGLFNSFKKFLKKKSEDKVEYPKYQDENSKKIISNNIEENKKYLGKLFNKSDDIIYRNVHLENNDLDLLLVCIANMVDTTVITEDILKPIKKEDSFKNEKKLDLNKLKEKLITALEVFTSNDFNKLLDALLTGDTLLFVDGYDEALIIETSSWKERNVEAPSSEETVRGSRESFIESVSVNITLIRRRIRSIKLAVEKLKIGRNTQTEIAVIYLDGICNSDIVNEVIKRIKKIDTDGVVGSAQVEQLIESYKWTVFPQILATERVDRTIGNILEGRLAIIVDGTPFVLIAPVTFASFLNSPDDYYERTLTSSFMRIIRYISYFITTTLPALYLALTAYHPGMIPTPLVLTITESRVGLPFPTILEVFFMEFTLEILTEASIRLPRPIGQTVSIVGGLVIGQSAVQAGVVSPILIIIVSITAITSFIIPIYTFTLSNRMVRFPLIILAGTLGLYGIFMGWIFLLIHLASLESFGVRYLSDFSPYRLNSLKDTIIKVPQSLMNKRPEVLNVEDVKRQNTQN